MTSAVATWQGGYRCRVTARHHELVADEPGSVGGTDTGPTPTELLLAAVASCFAMALSHVAARQGVTLPEGMRVHAEGTYAGPRFARVDVRVEAAGAEALVETLLERAARVCYVSNTLRASAEVAYGVAPPSG